MASAREYRNLKEYRDKELKWFLLANIILMLIESGVLDFGKLESISISDISSLLGITAVSSAIYIYTFILDSILPSRVKVFLVFLWKRQPSCTIFTDMEQKFEDDRFKLEDAKKKYHQIYERIKSEPDSFDQTPLWYEIYNKHRNNTIIFGSNPDYLLLRDMHKQTNDKLYAYFILWCFTGVLWLLVSILVRAFKAKKWYTTCYLLMLMNLCWRTEQKMINKIYDPQYAPACFFRRTVYPPQMKVMLQITERCNLRCAHCFAESRESGREMPLEHIQKIIIPQFSKRQVVKVTLTGGEPLTHPQMKEIVSSLLENNIGVSICTNGTLIDLEWSQRLTQYDNIHFNVSLDGFRVSSHGRFRGMTESDFAQLLQTIRVLGEQKLLNGILTTPNNYASIGEYVELCQFAKEAGAKYVLMNPLSPFGRGVQTQLLSYSEEDMSTLKRRTLSMISDDFEIDYIRFPNVERLPIGKCPLGAIPYIFCNGDIAICPYMVFAAANSQRYVASEFVTGNIYDGAEIATSIESWIQNKSADMFRGDNMCVGCNKGCYAIKIARGQSLSGCDDALCPQKKAVLMYE